MAYTAISVYQATGGGTSVTESAGVSGGAGTGYKFVNDGRTAIMARNTGTNTPNVIVITSGTVGGHSIGDDTIAFASGGVKLLGPYDPAIYNVNGGSDDGYVYVCFSGSNETDMKVSAVRI